MTWQFMQLEGKSRPLTAEQVGGDGEWNPVINGLAYWHNQQAGIRATEMSNGALLLKFEAGYNGLEQVVFAQIPGELLQDIALSTILPSAGFTRLDAQ